MLEYTPRQEWQIENFEKCLQSIERGEPTYRIGYAICASSQSALQEGKDVDTVIDEFRNYNGYTITCEQLKRASNVDLQSVNCCLI